MNDLATQTIAAHGGLDAWRRYTSVCAHLSQGGGLWDMKANGAQIADVDVMVATDRQWASTRHSERPALFLVFEGGVAIESEDGRVVQELLAPRPPSLVTSCRHRGPTCSWRSSSAAPCGHTSTCRSCSPGLASKARSIREKER